MGTTQDLIRWCITEREKLCDELEDFEAMVVNVLARDERAAIGQIVSKIERVKTRIANLDCILRKRRADLPGTPTGAACSRS